MKVLVNTSVLRNESNNMMGILLDMQDCIKKMGSVINDSTINWQGTDNTVYVKKMSVFSEELKDFANSIESYINYLIIYNESILTLDNSYSSKTISLK